MEHPRQMSYFQDKIVSDTLIHRNFSHDNVCEDNQRIAVEEKYQNIFVEDYRFNRKLVSFQANKGEIVHGWIKYREGFSAQLVSTLLSEFNIKPGQRILDPFAGSATTLLVAKTKGIDAEGIEILPNCNLSWEAKSNYQKYDVRELEEIQKTIGNLVPRKSEQTFPHITITESAFPDDTERDIMYFTEWIETSNYSPESKLLIKLIITSILEEVSYTRKDGQYLRWDYRSKKVENRNSTRTEQGKKPIKKIYLGDLPTAKQAITKALRDVIADIKALQRLSLANTSKQKFFLSNTLSTLPKLPENYYDAVITSPPYVNRYDYTRTYALELAYLGYGKEINFLRQQLLSCTVESRSKDGILREVYDKFGMGQRFDQIINIARSSPVLQEVNRALRKRWERGDMNNKGVLSMVDQYFTELTFIFAELFRVCKPNASVAFVNDNTRYGGEIIPVDTITTNLAEEIGFIPTKIYILPQRKGNSSQQMGKFGRVELRKSITVWRKP